MNIVIIEDNIQKMEDIKKYILKEYNPKRIITISSLMKSLYYIKENHEYIDLIILDWNFPMYENEYPGIAMGNHVLNYISKRKYDIDIIICSSDNLNINNDNVKKIVLYNPGEELDFTYNKGKKRTL